MDIKKLAKEWGIKTNNPVTGTECIEAFATAISAKAIEDYKASLELVAYMWQHEETGNIGFVDQYQIDNGFEKGNPRLNVISPLYALPLGETK